MLIYTLRFLPIFIVVHAHKSVDSPTDINFADFINVADAFAALMRVFTKELSDADFATIRTICLTRAGKRLQNEISRTTNIHNLFELLACNPFYFNWMNVEYLQTVAGH